jgi:hypothetical protein
MPRISARWVLPFFIVVAALLGWSPRVAPQAKNNPGKEAQRKLAKKLLDAARKAYELKIGRTGGG